MTRWLSLGATLLVLSAGVLADTAVMHDGRVFQGKIVSQSAEKVVFKVYSSGAVMTLTLKPGEIKELKTGPLPEEKKPDRAKEAAEEAKEGVLTAEPEAPPIEKPDGPSYCRIPLTGVVGQAILSENLDKALADAVRRKPDVVVLDVDSPGGSVPECGEILDVIRKYNRKLRLVAYTDDALSAAAVLSLACPEIYIRPSGKIGAATSYIPGNLFLPKHIEEKMQSVWRATARGAAEAGGHNPLLAEAMIDRNMQLHLDESSGGKVVKRGLATGKKTICRKGKLLTITALEAVDIGLAKGTPGDYSALGVALGYPSWTEQNCHGVLLAEWWGEITEAYQEKMTELEREYRVECEQAEENNPYRFKYTYYRSTERLTPRSQTRWRQRSIACARHYRRAAKNVGEAIELSKPFEHLAEFREHMEELKFDLEAKADKFYRNRRNYDVHRDAK